jgi:multiple sugar transport system permease protein
MVENKLSIAQRKGQFRFSNNLKENLWGYLFITPQLIGLLAFTIFPVLFSLYLCFTRWDFVKAPEVIGLKNFQTVFADELFWQALVNTVTLVIGIVPLTMFLAFGLALLTNRQIKGLYFYKAAFFLPLVTSSVATVSLWYWLYAPDFGMINNFLVVFNLQGPGWLTDPFWAKVAVTIMIAWQSLGWFYLIFLAGLKNIPQDYYEVAAIDGANFWQKLFKITLPLLSPTTFFILTTIMISTFNIFNEPYILTRGGPEHGTYTLVYHIFNKAFRDFEMGQAAVVSWILFLILFVITAVQFRLGRKWVHYGE